MINGEFGKNKVKKSKDLGAFCWEKLVKIRLLSSDFRIFPNMGLFFNTRYVVQTFDLHVLEQI
ncbi:hypothetical protein DWV49_02995 [Lactobacillus amylovorus subsp. animalium]|nr:hypothetical protein DWV49_02995 [Lactobacillus amylovorus]